MIRVKSFASDGTVPNGRLYAGDLNAIQDAVAAITDYTQSIALGNIRIGESGLQLLKYATGEARLTGALRTDGLLRGLGGIIPGAFTTAARNAIATGVGLAPYGVGILNTTTNQWEWNRGNDTVRDWQPFGVTDAIRQTLIDAKGDLIVGTANDTAARKAVGVNGRYLRADSAQTDGMNWAQILEGDVTFTPGSTVGDAATGRHGFLMGLLGGTAKFAREDGTWAVPPGTAGSPAGTLLKVTVLDPTNYPSGSAHAFVTQTATRQMVVWIVGSGGGGGNGAWSSSGDAAAGGGGSSGALTIKYYDVTHGLTGGMTIYFIIGAIGSGGAASSSAQTGNNGSSSKFDCSSSGGDTPSLLGGVVKASAGSGGAGGAHVTAGAVSIVNGGSNAGAQAPLSDNSLLGFAGNHGGVGLIISNSDGTSAKAKGGEGAAGPFGGLVMGSLDSGSSTGGTGKSFGGGGGGAASSESGPSRPGGDGAPGVIVVFEYS